MPINMPLNMNITKIKLMPYDMNIAKQEQHKTTYERGQMVESGCQKKKAAN